MRSRIASLLVVPALLTACASFAPAPDDYVARGALALTPGPDRIAGRLELLEDARRHPEMRDAIAEAYGGDPCADRPPAVLAPPCGSPSRAPLCQPPSA